METSHNCHGKQAHIVLASIPTPLRKPPTITAIASYSCGFHNSIRDNMRKCLLLSPELSASLLHWVQLLGLKAHPWDLGFGAPSQAHSTPPLPRFVISPPILGSGTSSLYSLVLYAPVHNNFCHWASWLSLFALITEASQMFLENKGKLSDFEPHLTCLWTALLDRGCKYTLGWLSSII